jgi:hypothetical protein
LPRPLVIPKVVTLTTLADVCGLIKHVPKERRQFSTWRTVEKALNEAAAGADPIGVRVPPEMTPRRFPLCPGLSRSKALQTGRCGRDYINRIKSEVQKRSEMPLQLTSWCLQLLVALSKAGP